MRRIIAGLISLTLTACAGQQPDETPAVESVAAGAPDRTPAQPAARTDSRVVLFVGTSLTAGYGVGEDLAYPALIQQKIDSVGLPFRVVNAGISGETSAGGLRRIDWSLQQPTDVLVLELGANDALRGLDPTQMEENLDSIAQRARNAWPDIDIVIIGMEAPPNLGQRYTSRFRQAFRTIAERHDAALIPFLLEGVAADPSLNIEDGVHPNAAGQRILARTVWSVLEQVLRERAAAPPASR